MDPAFTVVVIIAAVAAVIVGLLGIGLARMSLTVRRARAATAHRPSQERPLAGARGVVDQSIGMYLLRRLIGRPTSSTAEPAPPPEPSALRPDEIAYRSRIARAVPPVRPTHEIPAALAAASRADARRPAPAADPAVTRERLARDTGFALAGLAAIGLVAFIVWPTGGPQYQPTGTDRDVAGASATLEPGGSAIPVATSVAGADGSPGGSVAAETFVPGPLATRAPTSPPNAGPRATPRSTPRGTASPSPTPTLEPTPSTATPGPTPAPTAQPTPTPQATPAPGPTPTPVPTASASGSG